MRVEILKEHLNACLSQRFDAIDVIVSTQGWDSIVRIHEEEICSVVDLDADIVRAMAEYVSAATQAKRFTLFLFRQSRDAFAFLG